MITRDIATIDAEIKALKDENPNWVSNAGDKALMTQLLQEKNNLHLTTAPQVNSHSKIISH
jgi:hypothetical protein